ncbi:MAG TPA: universal stress protein [Chthoniobacterales bacterium]|jgi:nucleotide-binding universal stress UspA family protein
MSSDADGLEETAASFDLAGHSSGATVHLPSMYRSIAAATTFSPRFHAVLSEAGRTARYFGGRLRLIHVGEETEEKRERIHAGLAHFELAPDTDVHWIPGDPATVICQIASEFDCDLVVAGAVRGEAGDTGYRPFANDIARKLIAEAPVDLFLFLEPQEANSPIRCPAVLVDFTETSAEALRQAVKVAEARGAEIVHAFQVLTTFDEHRLRSAGFDGDADERLDQFVLDSTPLDVPVETHCIRGNTGFAACEYLQGIGADLLVVPTGMPGKTDPVLSPSLDWLYQVIPCNLWVIRDRTAAATN